MIFTAKVINCFKRNLQWCILLSRVLILKIWKSLFGIYSLVQRWCSLKHRLYSGCHMKWFQCLYLSLIAAFKQRPAALLYCCFAVAKFCSAFAMHKMWRSLLERLTSTALQMLKCCATIKVYRCSTAAALRRSYGKFLVQIRVYINPSSLLRKFYSHVVMETTVLVKSSLCHSMQTTQCRTFTIGLVLNAQTLAIAKLSREGNTVKFARL